VGVTPVDGAFKIRVGCGYGGTILGALYYFKKKELYY